MGDGADRAYDEAMDELFAHDEAVCREADCIYCKELHRWNAYVRFLAMRATENERAHGGVKSPEPNILFDAEIACVRCLKTDVDLDGDSVCEHCHTDLLMRRIDAND
jgi:hypothetical protein